MVDYPTILKGEVLGPIRCESLDGSEIYLNPLSGGFGLRLIWDSQAIGHLTDFAPFERDGKTWAVSTIQKKSTRGWLKTDPDCFYWWRIWKLQETFVDQNGVTLWKPGTERGVYFRKPFSWRWDAAGTLVNGVLQHFIWTKGYLGGHYD